MVDPDHFRAGSGLDDEERDALGRQAQKLDVALRPASPRELGEELINPILQLMPVAAETAAFRAEAYFEALDGVPLFAAVAARQAFFQDRSGLSTDYAPTPPQLARLVRRMAEPFACEAAVIDRLLRASEEPPPPDEAEMAKRKAHADEKLLRWRRAIETPAEAPEDDVVVQARREAELRQRVARQEEQLRAALDLPEDADPLDAFDRSKAEDSGHAADMEAAEARLAP
ncbi:hypothetical protein [Afifella sp. YEN Y35]|uniref:hypothetical protein n=1 Tax=Afifella sp. YEN Y35 TaxID=3388337 RepID=UPI0039DFFFB6